MNKITHTIEEIPIEEIVVPITHPRRDPGDLKNLDESIQRKGLLELITVTRGVDGIPQVVDGTRRLTILASRGEKTILCKVLGPMDQAQITITAYEINNERKSLNPIEQALHIQTMQESFGYSLRDLEVLGYGSPSKTSQTLKLLTTAELVQKNVSCGRLTVAHGVELSKITDKKQQEKMTKQVIDFELSAKRTGIKVEKFLKKSKKPILKKYTIPEGDIPGVYFKDSKDMSELPDKSVHFVVTSSPYHVGQEYEKSFSYQEHWENIQRVADELARVLVAGGIIAINVADIHNFRGPKGNNDFPQIMLVGHVYQKFFSKHGIYLTDMIAWVKSRSTFTKDIPRLWSDKLPHTGYRIINNHEPVYIFRKKGERELPSEEIILKSHISKAEWDQWAPGIWMIDRVRKMDGHPAMFPEELVRRLVRMYSYEGDVVLDPFLGSGTTVKVARELGRQAYGYERLEQYKEVIMKKLGIDPAPETYSMVDYMKQSLALNISTDMDSFLEPSAESKSCKPHFFSSEGFADGLLTRI